MIVISGTEDGRIKEAVFIDNAVLVGEDGGP
jgi:hypothetical protein